MRKAIALRGADSERGAYAILFAVLIVVLFIMVAMAVDLSDARARVKENRNRVDFAGLAAGSVLQESGPWEACREAWTYIKTNTRGFPSTAVSPCDSGVGSDATETFQSRYEDFDPGCQPDSDPTNRWEYHATGEEPYEVIFTYPVTDAVLADLSAAGRPVDADLDGEPCARFGVTMATSQGALFGGIVGSQGIQAPASSVVLATTGDDISEIAALIILDPEACNVLITGGQGFVEVRGSQGIDDEGNPVSGPGIIAVDSLANGGNGNNACSGQRRAIDANNNALNFIEAGEDPLTNVPGIIAAFGMRPGQQDCLTGNDRVCDQGDVNSSRLRPLPIRALKPVTRRPVDHKYNCNESYPGLNIEGCETATSGSVSGTADGDTDYIDQLVADVGTTGVPSGLFDWWPETLLPWRDYLTDDGVVDGSGTPLDEGAGARCSPSAARVRVPAGNWYVNCPGPQGFNPGNRVDFEGVAGANMVVFANQVRPGSNAQVSFNVTDAALPLDAPNKCPDDDPGPAQPPGIVYVRNSDFVMSGPSNLVICNSTLYVRNGVADAVTSGTVFSWIAPFSGPLEDLALWSESSGQHRLGGQTALNIEGVFFTPNATPFAFTGQPSQSQTKAQFFTYRLNVSGQGGLVMSPHPARSIPTPIFGFRLIR